MGRRPSQSDQAWAEAKKLHRLSNAHVQMARRLGLNPRKLGKIDNHRQEPWKLPLRQFIERLYEERFGNSVSETRPGPRDRSRTTKATDTELDLFGPDGDA